MEHPIWGVLKYRGLTLRWLARKIAVSEDLVYAVKMGRRQPSVAFRAKCAEKLDLPESLLFNSAPPAAAPETTQAVA